MPDALPDTQPSHLSGLGTGTGLLNPVAGWEVFKEVRIPSPTLPSPFPRLLRFAGHTVEVSNTSKQFSFR